MSATQEANDIVKEIVNVLGIDVRSYRRAGGEDVAEALLYGGKLSLLIE